MHKAFKRIMERLADAEAAGKLPDKLCLATYSDDASLRRFRPGESWPGGAAEHARTMLSISIAIARKYPTVDVLLKEIDEAKYDAWIVANGLDDTAGNRAAFITILEKDA